VNSYFSPDIVAARGPAIEKMVREAVTVRFEETDSVLEAILLEANLIKKHQPPYNSREKDDKSFNYLVITKEAFPRVLVVRGKDLDRKFAAREVDAIYGPFPYGLLFREAMRIIRKIFPFRDTCVPCEKKSGTCKPCFNAQIGLCPGPCAGTISRPEYRRMVRHLKLFFEGKKKTLLRQLEREMKVYARNQEFEQAGRVKRTIFALQHIQDVQLLKRPTRDLSRGGRTSRVEGYDIAHLGGTTMTGVMVVVEDGEANKAEYRKFRIKTVEGANDTAALKEVLTRRLNHNEWRLPSLVVVDGGKAQINAAQKVLAEFGYEIPVVSVVKDEHHRPREVIGRTDLRQRYENDILLANAEAHRFVLRYHRDLRKKFQ
jgi:excinuclease ABC subunit C